jgi:SAM-dependent methyltransferase
MKTTARSASVRESYDALASAYAEAYAGELDGKPLDRALLGAFAEMVRGRGPVVDVGCGPGHVAAKLHELGVECVEGVDLSEEMIRLASERFPALRFRQGDFHALPYASGSLAGVAAFYAIVHLSIAELAPVFRELHRCLAPGALLLLAFHVGDEARPVDELLGQRVSLTFRFLPTAGVRAALEEVGFAIEAVLERQGSAVVEHPTLRAYLLARACPPGPR